MPGADFGNPTFVAEFVLTIFVLLGIDALLFLIVKRWAATLSLLIPEFLAFLFYCLGMPFLALFFLILMGVTAILVLFVNMNVFRGYLSNRGDSAFFRLSARKKRKEPERLYDRDAFLEKLVLTAMNMSRLRRGALITIERKDDILDDGKLGDVIRQKGVRIDAPFVPELVETIFYEGTRLHDGAIVVKDGIILRAAVFFAATERPLNGKFGPRHQAAIGISEKSDSVTLVVSEETGRIAIAFQGELTHVTPDNLLRVLEDDLSYSEDEED